MRDWEQNYEDGATPWDTGRASTELQRLVESGGVAPCRALDLGCGTGANVVYLAELGFDVTGIDLASGAIAQAEALAKEAGVEVDLRKGDLLDPDNLEGPFDFIFARGCLHTFQEDEAAAQFVAMLERVSRSGTVYLLMCGNAKEPRTEGEGPPVLSEEQIRVRLEPLFTMESLREFRFGHQKEEETEPGEEGPLGYVCLMRRAG